MVVDSANVLHLACAESIGAIMLTTDDNLEKLDHGSGCCDR